MNVICERTTELSQTVVNLANALQDIEDDHTCEVIYLTIERLCDTISASLQAQRKPEPPVIQPHWTDYVK